MSWSVYSTGKPAAVKADLMTQFSNAKKSTANIPHEQASVEAIEKIVNDQIDFLADCRNLNHPQGAQRATLVKVEAAGSAYKSQDGSGSSQVSLKVEPISIVE